MSAFYDVIETPVGPMFIGGSSEGIHRLDFLPAADGTVDGRMVRDLAHSVARLEALTGEPAEQDAERAAETTMQLREYFAGERTEFSIALAPRGTEFQLRVWDALREIPTGETRSYGAIAARIGAPGSARAVGAANGQNPIAVVVPCHRVVGSTGTLTGYGGGLDRKRWLLEHEAHALPLFAAAS